MGSHSQQPEPPPQWQQPVAYPPPPYYQPPQPQTPPPGYQYPPQPGYGPPTYPPAAYPPPGYQPRGANKPPPHRTRNAVLLAIVGVLVLVVVIAAIVGGGDKKKSPAAQTAAITTSNVISTSAAASKTAPTTSAPAPTPTIQTIFKAGTPVPITQGGSNKATYTVNSIKVGATTGNQYEKPSNGQFVVVDVTVQGTAGSVDYNPFDFTVSTPDLRSWQSGPSWFDPGFHSGTVTAGQAIRGNITFDVEAGPVSGVNLVSGGLASGKVIATWTP